MKLMEWPSAKVLLHYFMSFNFETLLTVRAQADCDKALDIEPNFVRALERRGNCYVMFLKFSCCDHPIVVLYPLLTSHLTGNA